MLLPKSHAIQIVTDPSPAHASGPSFCRSLLELRRRAMCTALLCLGTDLANTYLGPATPLSAAAWLALNSCNQAGAAEARFVRCALLCLATDLATWSLYTLLQNQPQPASDPPFCAAWLALNSCNQAGTAEVHFPRCMAVTYLAAVNSPFLPHPTPAQARDPPSWLALNSCNHAGAAEARFVYSALLCFVADLVA